MKNFKKSIVSGVCLLSILSLSGGSLGFATLEETLKTETKLERNLMDPTNLDKKCYDSVDENANLQSENTKLKKKPTKSDSENFTDPANLANKYYDMVVENANLQSENTKLKQKLINLESEDERLKKKYEKNLKKTMHLKSKLEKKKEYMTKEEVQNEIERVKLNMTLEFTRYLSEYVKNNPKKKLKHIDMGGVFKDFLTFNVNYTNKGDTNFTPLAIKGVAKGTVAGGAAMTK